MIGCELQWGEMYNFFNYKEKDNYIATVCTQQDAEFMAGGGGTLYFRYCQYSDDDIKRVMDQAEQWQIKCIGIEHWDPSYGYTPSKVKRETTQQIDIHSVLVQDGNFAGVVGLSKDIIGRYGLGYALTSSYVDTPLQFCTSEGYGSSDCDMMYKNNFYLEKL